MAQYHISAPSPAVLRGGSICIAHIDLSSPQKAEFDKQSTRSSVASSTVYHSKDVIAPYIDVPLPPYSQEEKHDQCVAELCFKYGFVFFPLWIYATSLLRTPLAPPTGELPFMPASTDSEKQAHLRHLRQEELVWARKSFKALIVFVFVVIVALGLGLGLYFGLKHNSSSELASTTTNQMPNKAFNKL